MINSILDSVRYFLWCLIENYRFARDVGFIFFIKYKLGLARPGIDFIDFDEDVFDAS